ncbi:invasion associated locus B family protein [Methylobacterium aerolatum]|uniref:Invasion protein IalB n=1 Tax=Methylobacterium aerolatum TaxID=418708 RepID=A0ABU0I891_9HYPH|nr:invasion associated locus B family protein [Methylobacterium aerolatum]MDQ0449864.1 invasion protein IalB [Methylobacterium aerolatum]GJD36631.1 hypothetical protein FMGBMHLM_3554 [Methylobacterium aerolatum]
MPTITIRGRGRAPGAVLAGMVVLGLTAALPARAQPAAPAKPAPPVSAEPGATTASYGDWLLRCQRGGSPEKPVRVCEAMQSMQVKGQNQPIAQIAIGRAGTGEPLQVTTILPPNVIFPSSVRVQLDEKEPGLELAWRRCLPGACAASAPAGDDAIKRWRAATVPGRIVFRNAGGQDVAIPLSWRGLPQALDALARE